MRIALLLPLSGRAAPIGQSLQQAAEMALFDTGAKELALAAYDSGDRRRIPPSRPIARPASTAPPWCWGRLFGTSATALAPLVEQGGANVVSLLQRRAGRPARRLDHGHRRPAAGRAASSTMPSMSGVKRFAAFAPQTSYGQQMVADHRRARSTIRGGKVAAVELFDANSADPHHAGRDGWPRRPGRGDKLAVLVPVAPPRLSAALAALAAAGIDNKSVQLIGTGVWDVPDIGAEVMLRGAWYAAPDPAKRADFERRFLSTYGRPPHRLATLAYDGVSLAGHLARG